MRLMKFTRFRTALRPCVPRDCSDGKSIGIVGNRSFHLERRLPHCGRALQVFLVAILLTGCQHDMRSAYEGCLGIGMLGSERLYCDVSIIELLGNPDRLNGMDVFVGGFVLIDESAGEIRLVRSLDEEWQHLTEAAIHLDISLEESKGLLRHRRYADVMGRFEWRVSLRNPYRRTITEITVLRKLLDDEGT